jgi:hypothetical protein
MTNASGKIKSHRHLHASLAVHVGSSSPLNGVESVHLLIYVFSLLEEEQRIDRADKYCSFQFATIGLHHGYSGMQIQVCSYTLIIVGIWNFVDGFVAMYMVSFSLNGDKLASKMCNMLVDDGTAHLVLMWPHT